MLVSAAVIVLRPSVCRNGCGYRVCLDSGAGLPGVVVGLLGPGQFPLLGEAPDWLRHDLALHVSDGAAIEVGARRWMDIEQALARVAEDVPAGHREGACDDSEAEYR